MPKYKKDYVPMSIKLPEDMVQRIKEIAEKSDVAYVNIIKMAIAEWLERYDNRTSE